MSSYFFDGCANTNAGQQQYSIFDPVYNRFVIVSDDCDALTKTIMLLSGKTQLYLVTVQQANNWDPNVIDNHCCENWGLSRLTGYNLFAFPETKKSLIIEPVPDLAPNTLPVSDIEKELKNFAFLSHSVIQHWANCQDWFLYEFYDYIDCPALLQEQKQLERQVYHAIYSAVNYIQAEAEVNALMSQAPGRFDNKKIWAQR